MTDIDVAAPEGAAGRIALLNGATAPAGDGGMTPAGTGGIVVTMPNGRRGAPVRAYDNDMIERVRKLMVDTDMSRKEIAAKTGVSSTTIRSWERKYRWERPNSAPPAAAPRDFDPLDRRQRLAHRIYRNLGRQLADLERRPNIGGRETAEKDARTLGVLAKTLQTLMDLDRDGAKVGEPEPLDRDELDADLADRITRWAQGGADS